MEGNQIMEKEDKDVERFVAEKYPGLVAELQPSGSCIVQGVMCCEGTWRRLKLYLPHHPALHGFQLYVQEHLMYKIYTSDNLKVQDDWLLEDLLANLAQILPAPEALALFKDPLPEGNIYSDILALHKPNEYLMQMDEACTRLRFSEFSDYEHHYLELEIPSLRLLDHSLPECVPLGEMLTKSAGTLEEALILFLKVLQELRPFYDHFMDIDELCHVLQPSPITTKHNSRVFPLKDRVFLKVTIGDPFACIASMALKIIGPTEEVAHLRHVLSDGLGNWDAELDMHKNLLRIFDLCFFPMPDWSNGPKQDEEENEELRCNICFVYRLDGGEVPLVSCDNARCVLKCHAACLKEWFTTLMDGKTFLEVSFGLCPFCKAKLSTSFAALLND
ncbi:E3 ubiquitin-protein ligase FANCL [Drosophila elegans]|uniref:E3 ubiquitin-protein ligase FANCL n=1 Tax=Drosophila elegans TaxID=30023 RepID=UPI0007E7B4EA|nr:E3 ubiquitin-protein ligase FANCL [Drosophila elegans]